jgi:hypothetical protein
MRGMWKWCLALTPFAIFVGIGAAQGDWAFALLWGGLAAAGLWGATRRPSRQASPKLPHQ